MGRLLAAVQTALRLTATAIALLAIAPPCHAAEEASLPISIEANRMVSQENQNTVLFLGKVDARQGNLTIRSEEMTVFYTEKKDGQASDEGSQPTSQVEKLICKNNVKITQGDWLGTGDRMDYFAKERKVVLSGNAKAWQGQNMVSGKTIVYYLDEKRSVVEPDASTNGRVKAVIHPDSKKKP
jgi:lipopolysaccharide export system protein LptA